MSAPYVALGDSYAAGVGGAPPEALCWRTRAGYPLAVAATLGRDVAYQACIGATVPWVAATQLAALGEETAYVSMTVGGNDAGFVPVLVRCAEPAWMGSSDPRLDEAMAVITGRLPGLLGGLYAAVRRRAPHARVVVTTYPRLFMGVDCNPATFFTKHEMERLGEAVEAVGDIVRRAAAAVGFDVADVREEFAGHAVCAPVEWVNGASWPVERSFHPNRLGHAEYADAVVRAFGGPTQGVVPERIPRVLPGPQGRGPAPTFSLPDLLGERSLRGAADLGLDVAEIERLAALVQDTEKPSLAPRDAGECWARLHEIDAEARRRL